MHVHHKRNNNSTIFKTIKANILDLIKYQQALASMNGIQLTSWQALKEGIIATGKAMLANPATWMVAGLTSIAVVAYKCSDAIKEVRNKAEELNTSFSSSKSEIDDYKSKINDLYKTINDSGSSIEDVTTARQNLMSIQDQLIEKFGDEKGAIDLITDAINGQTDALNILTEAQWQAAKNEFNESGFWNNVANGIDGYSNNIDRMLGEYEGYSVTIDMSKYGGTLFTEGYDEFKQMLMDDFGATISQAGSSYLELSGDASEVRQKLLDIQEILKENGAYKPDDTFSDYLGGLERSADDVITKYEDFYKQYVLYEEIFTNDTFTDSYKKINEAYSKYQDAFATGDEESIKKAQDNFASILTQATEGVSDESVVDFFNDMYPDLQEVVGNWQFETNFTANTDGLKDDVSGYLSGLDGLYSYDLKNFSYDTATEEQKASYDGLISVARLYGLTIDQLIDKLALMGLVQDENYKKLVDLFGQETVDKLTPEDLEIAYSISSEEADKALEQEKNKIKSELESLSKEGNVDLTIRPVIDSSAMQAAGWDVEDGSIATTFTQGEFIWQGDEENGQYVYVHYTPILPDGTVLTPNELTDYLYGTLEGSQNILDADNKGIVLKVDTDLNIPEGDIRKFTNGEGSTDAIDGLIQKTGEWDDKVHSVQEQYYDTGESIDYASNALDGLIEKHKQIENPDKTDISFTDQLSQIQLLSKGLEQLDKIYSDVWDGQTFDWSSILNNDEFEKTFGDFKEEYNELIKTIANSPNDVDACQESFNKLATAYVYGREELKNVTEETKSATVAMLQQVGVSNALEVVEAQLAINTANAADAQATLNQMKAQGIDTSVDLENATAVELLTLCQEGEQAGINTSALYNYVMQKIQANRITISTSGDVKALMNLCKGLGVASKALGKYESIKARFDSLKNKTDSESIRTRQALGYQMSQLVQEMNDSVSDLANLSVQTPVNFTGGEATKKVQEQASKDAEKSAETFDWIERAITNVQKKVERLGKVVSSTFKTWSTRNNALVQEMNAVAESINVQANAYNAYMAQANSVGLSDYYKGLVQSGAYNIEEVANDTLKEQIQKYQEFYDKAIECSDAIDDLRANMAELAKQKFDNISSEFDARLNAIEHRTNMLNKSMELNETKGYITATTYYEELAKIEQNNINEFIKEREALTKAMNEAISNGTIQVYSEDWYEMQKSIMDVDESIQDATNSIAEFQDKIRETKWELFDRIQDTISQLQSESDFIIDLMSNGKLFEDNGNWTNQATATGGLHAVNYNVYMAQSDEYAKEIENINKELANDPYNTKLLDRRKELLEAQRESIKAAEQEKQSIKDLYSQGYDNMLSYLQKLIDKRKELLNAEKDLFSYEKQISEQTKNIGSLEKQLGAMYGDNSEETQAKIQQIKVQLEEARSTLQETEYDKWLSDQQMILDNIYSEAEQWVNERLDNIDNLFQEMIDTTNAKAVEIGETIVTETEKVGYKLSEDMSRLFTISDGNITNVVTRYGDNFINSFTTVNSTLLDIKKSVDEMVKKAEEQAKAEAERLAKEEAQRQAQAQQQAAQQAAQQASTPTPAPAPTPSSTPAQTTPSWGSWFITGSQYYDRNATNTETSIVDRLKSRSINSAFSARARYYTAMGGSGTYTGSASQNTWMIQQMKAHGYYKGSKRIKEDELAWTQEKGQELIYRSSDGAMLTPLGQGDSVFTNDMTQTLWSFAKNPKMFANLVSTTTAIPHAPSTVGTVNNDVVMNVTLPNVTNPDDFINELRTNKKFEKVIQSMTIGNAMGNNTLNKMRIR